MRRRANVDETLPPVVMPGWILNELFNHALETQPEECCGLIMGNAQDRYQRLVRCRNEMTQRHQRDRVKYPRSGTDAFWMNEHDYQRAQEKAESDGLAVTAVYHSHVGSAVYFSEMDLAFAESRWFPFPEAEHIVLSVSEGAVRGLGVFARDPLDGSFCGRGVTPAAP